MLTHGCMVNTDAVQATKVVDDKATILIANLGMMPRNPPIIDHNIIGDMPTNLDDFTIQPIDLFCARLAATTAQTENRLGHLWRWRGYLLRWPSLADKWPACRVRRLRRVRWWSLRRICLPGSLPSPLLRSGLAETRLLRFLERLLDSRRNINCHGIHRLTRASYRLSRDRVLRWVMRIDQARINMHSAHNHMRINMELDDWFGSQRIAALAGHIDQILLQFRDQRTPGAEGVIILLTQRHLIDVMRLAAAL